MIREIIIPAVQYMDSGVVDAEGTIGPVEYMVPAVPLPDNMLTNRLEVRGGESVYVVTYDDGLAPVYTVTWTGMDGSENEDEFPSLELAQKWRTFIEERGAQMITISDESGQTY